MLALATVATGGVAASPQPTVNSTETTNATATATTTTSAASTTTATPAPATSSSTATPTPTAAPTPTGTPRPSADDVLDDVDPENATVDDVRTVAEWVRSEGSERGGEQADRARRWLANATGGGNISLPNISLGGNGTATATPMPTEPPAPESDGNATRIDSATAIVASEYVPKKGVARVTIRSEIVQNIVFSDGGFLSTGGGKGETRTESFGAGETSTVQIPVTEVNGRAAVVIGTENTPLYGVIVKEGGGGLDIIRELEPLQALLIGVIVAFVWVVIAGWNELRGERGRPEVA
ncbi:hypothetical protein ACFQL4_09500 [Halosimplex aquaticum]